MAPLSERPGRNAPLSNKSTWLKLRSDSPARTYLLVAASILLTTLLRHALTPVLGPRAPFIMYLPALVFSAWIGGWGGGVAAIISSAMLATYLFITPKVFFSGGWSVDKTTLLIFIIVGLSVSAISNSQRNAQQEAQDAAEEARRTAEALAESEARYRRLLETANEGVSITDAGDRITYINPRMEEMLGYKSQELIGLSVYELVFPEDMDAIRTRREPGLRRPREQYEVRMRHKDGSGVHMLANVSVQREGDDYAGTFALMTDITERKALEAEREALLVEAQTRAEREALVNEVGHAVLWSANSTSPQSKALMLLGERLNVDRCFYVLYDDEHNMARIEEDWRRNGVTSLEGEWSLGDRGMAIMDIYPEGKTVVVADVAEAPLPGNLVKLFLETGQRAYVAVPFFDQERPLAALTVMMASEARVWTDDEVTLVEAVAVQVRGAMEAARAAQRERNISQQLQRALQPRLPESAPGLTLANRYKAALQEAGVGGDFYDVFSITQARVALVVGDVSGKGLAAAAQVATVRNMLRAFLYSKSTLETAVSDLNHVISVNALLSGFATLFVGCYDTVSGELSYVNCGQEPALIRRADDCRVEMLIPTGPVLGMDEQAIFSQHKITLRAGDALAIFTDGVTECGPNRMEMLGVDGVAALLEREISSDEDKRAGLAETLARRLTQGVDEASRGGVARDDVCLLVAVAQPR
jgi:PAS domain S-box-containing protein